MADIALLVAEEFEKTRKRTEEDGIEAINRTARAYAVAVRRKIEKRLGFSVHEEAETVSAARQPTSSAVGFSASDGLFSA